MSAEKIRDVRPFVSVVMIVAALFVFVFTKMEVRRMGYFALKLSQERRELLELKRASQTQLAQHTRPERIQKAAGREGRGSGQVIQVTGSRLALRQ